MLTLADQLRQLCPHCGQHTHGQGLDVDMTRSRALDMLIEFSARRDRLALSTSTEPRAASGFEFSA